MVSSPSSEACQQGHWCGTGPILCSPPGLVCGICAGEGLSLEHVTF